MSVSDILTKIDTLIAETEANSVSPSIVGNLMKEIVEALSALKTGTDPLAIDGVDDILAFLSGCAPSETLRPLLDELKTRLSNVETESSATSSSIVATTATVETLAATVSDVVAEVEALGDAIADVIADVAALSGRVDATESALGELEETVADERILPFAGFVYSLESVESPYEGQIVFVEELGRFRKYEHGSWDFNTTVSPYNVSQHGITIVNGSQLFRLSSTGSLYRKSSSGNRLESVAWSDDTVTQDQLTEATDSIYETISDSVAELRAEVSDGVVAGDPLRIEEETIDEMM